MPKRVFCSDLTSVRDVCYPEEEDKKYILKVLRLKKGDFLELFDGKGNVARAVIDGGKDFFCLKILEKFSVPPPFKLHFSIGLSSIRPVNFEFALIKCNELMVNEVIPLSTDYTRSSLRDNEISHRIERFKKLIIESSKQCKRDYLMKISGVRKFSEIITLKYDFKIMLDVSGKEKFKDFFLNEYENFYGKRVLLLIGPEGGWSEDERESARDNGFLILNAGSSVLKSETATLFGASLFYLFFYS